jgi:hypothetical protein
MSSASCQFLGIGSLNTFPQKQTRGTMGDLLLDNGAVNRLCQKHRLCFPSGPCKVVIRQSCSEAGSSVVVDELWQENEIEDENESYAVIYCDLL